MFEEGGLDAWGMQPFQCNHLHQAVDPVVPDLRKVGLLLAELLHRFFGSIPSNPFRRLG